MIITKQDIDEFVKRYWQYIKRDWQYQHTEINTSIDDISDEQYFMMGWLIDNPQIIIASGYQEYMSSSSSFIEAERFANKFGGSRPLFRTYEGQWLIINDIPKHSDAMWSAYSLTRANKHIGYEKDKTVSTQFFSLERMINKYIGYKEDKTIPIQFPSVNQILEKALKFIDNPLVDSTCFISPKIWTPEHQWAQKVYLQNSAVHIMKELKDNNKELGSINWREFEEVVAEIFRSKGMQIHIVKENPQGGRDIIARGELVPGMEVVTIAIEVKHKDVVDRPEVQTALYQNRMFPALMFVTSGRFTTGVIQEAMKPENRMRLFLKDGVAIRELLQAYRFVK